MNPSWILKQAVEFQKSTFDNSFGTVAMVQDHTEKVARTMLEQITWFPEEVKRVAEQWSSICRQGREDFKAAVDDQFSKARELFGQP